MDAGGTAGHSQYGTRGAASIGGSAAPVLVMAADAAVGGLGRLPRPPSLRVGSSCSSACISLSAALRRAAPKPTPAAACSCSAAVFSQSRSSAAGSRVLLVPSAVMVGASALRPLKPAPDVGLRCSARCLISSLESAAASCRSPRPRRPPPSASRTRNCLMKGVIMSKSRTSSSRHMASTNSSLVSPLSSSRAWPSPRRDESLDGGAASSGSIRPARRMSLARLRSSARSSCVSSRSMQAMRFCVLARSSRSAPIEEMSSPSSPTERQMWKQAHNLPPSVSMEMSP
mmetsp:Transcript_29723/g.86914  ORF Transcript_29723/g.86914 Transcript_29723/m.86914 type:complete len:286 (+) Transcript_29723:565-1422(+)